MSGPAPELVTSTPPLDRSERPVPEAWSRTDAPFPAERCIHQLFEDQSARTPDVIAVVCGEDSATCRELNERGMAAARASA